MTSAADIPSPPIAEQAIEAAVVSRLTRRLVPFLFVLYIAAYLDRINVGFAALQMRTQLGFSDAVYGIGAGMFFAGYFFFQVPSNLVLQRVGARRWIALLMILWGVISSCTALISTVQHFYFMRFLLGAAEAGFFPGVILYLKNWFPINARARTVASFAMAGALSGVVGGPLSGALLTLNNVGGLAGWQWLFLIEGLPSVILGGAVFFYLTDYPNKAYWLPDQQRAWLVETLESEKQNHPDVANTSIFTAFSSGRVWLLAFVYFGLNTVSYGMSLWLPTLIRSLSGMSSLALGVLSSVPYIAAAISMVLLGAHSDRTGERRWHVALPAFAGAGALVLAAQSNSVGPSIVLISIAVLAVFSMIGPLWAMPTTFLSGAAAAVGIAFINSVGNLGGFFGPYIIGLVRGSTGGFKGGLLVVGATLAFGGCLALCVRFQAAGRKAVPGSGAVG